jgi:transcriptional regulator with GAF, ATPase, and Fis domain
MHDQPPDQELQKIFARVGFISCSPAMMPLLRQARKAAEVSDVTVLLEGETGTGKQVLARGIHDLD